MSDKTKALAVTPAVGWTPDPKAPWRCLICGSERSACICLPREKVTPAVGGEALAKRLDNMARHQQENLSGKGRFNNFLNGNLAHEAAAFIRSAAPPASLLRGRESVREIAHRHCTCTCRGDPAVLQNHTNLCDSIADAILEYAAIPNKDPNE